MADAGPGRRLGFGEANKLILSASTLNMILPSKMGDIAKAYFMQRRGRLSGTLSLALVVFEKSCDMLSLLVWCIFGLALYPDKDWLFWAMTVCVTAGLVAGLLLLGSRVRGIIFSHGGRCRARKIEDEGRGDAQNRGTRCMITSGRTNAGWRWWP